MSDRFCDGFGWLVIDGEPTPCGGCSSCGVPPGWDDR